MFGKLFSREETTAALVLALSGTVMVLVAKGDGPLSSQRLVSGALSATRRLKKNVVGE
jgi:hypothetical protein